MPLTQPLVVKISGGSLSSNRSDVTFANANGVTFGLETNGVMTGSVNAQSIQPVAASGSNGSFLFSTLQFVTGNGATFVTDATGIRLSYTVPSVTEYQLLANSTLSLGTGATASFQFTSANSNFAGVSHSHGNP